MNRTSSLLHKQRVDLSQLPLDEELFRRVGEDLRANAGEHVPAEVWLAAGGGREGQPPSKFSPKDLLVPWLGFGSTPVTAESAFWYHRFLKNVDTIGIHDTYFESDGSLTRAGSELLVADLGTLVDLNFVAAFARRTGGRPLRVLEVGGGYGRLAEAFFNVFGGQVKWVCVDAVPASLIHANEYLK